MSRELKNFIKLLNKNKKASFIKERRRRIQKDADMLFDILHHLKTNNEFLNVISSAIGVPSSMLKKVYIDSRELGVL